MFQVDVNSFSTIPLSTITKLKVRRRLDPHSKNLPSDSMIMKVSCGAHDTFYTATMDYIEDFTMKIMWAKIAKINRYSDLYAPFNGQIEGYVMKKSQFVGKWEKRFIRINYEGLKSYRNLNKSPTMVVGETGELWTRFEYINGGHFMVVKIKHSGIKIEIGIPTQSAVIWMKAFYSLLRK